MKEKIIKNAFGSKNQGRGNQSDEYRWGGVHSWM